MKTYVQASNDYKDQLEEGMFYELTHQFETTLARSGIAVVINFEDEFKVYDSKFFV